MRVEPRTAGWVIAFLTFVIRWTTACSAGPPGPDDRTGTVFRDEPQAIYSPDPTDPWNLIFHALFTRTVRYQGEPPRGAGAPMEHLESGDRAIEPLDPFPIHIGIPGAPQRVLDEPHFTRLSQALTDLLREGSPRPPLARALMQSDLWAAHDVLFAAQPLDDHHRRRRDELLGLLARSIRKLALSAREIDRLPDN